LSEIYTGYVLDRLFAKTKLLKKCSSSF